MGRRFSLALFVFVVLCLFGINEAGKVRITRAIDGEPAEIEEFPYTAILTDEDGFLHCGGVLISEQSVLTTAQCLESYDDSVSDIFVRLGTNRWTEEGDEATYTEAIVETKVVHPNFDSSEMKNDIAILNFYSPVVLSTKVDIACISSSFDHAGKNATFSGWGVLEGGERTEVLHKLNLQVICLDDCEKKLDIFTFDDSNLCTYSPTKDICAGDQGGPLVIPRTNDSDTLIGVASWTTCTAGAPGIFTNVGKYIDWIKTNMVGGFSCFR